MNLRQHSTKKSAKTVKKIAFSFLIAISAIRLGRARKFLFAFQHHSISTDIISIAKGMVAMVFLVGGILNS